MTRLIWLYISKTEEVAQVARVARWGHKLISGVSGHPSLRHSYASSSLPSGLAPCTGPGLMMQWEEKDSRNAITYSPNGYVFLRKYCKAEVLSLKKKKGGLSLQNSKTWNKVKALRRAFVSRGFRWAVISLGASNWTLSFHRPHVPHFLMSLDYFSVTEGTQFWICNRPPSSPSPHPSRASTAPFPSSFCAFLCLSPSVDVWVLPYPSRLVSTAHCEPCFYFLSICSQCSPLGFKQHLLNYLLLLFSGLHLGNSRLLAYLRLLWSSK